MRAWDEYRQFDGQAPVDSGLRDDDETRGVIGVGLAHVLGLCESLKLKDCPTHPQTTAPTIAGGSAPAAAVLELAQRDREPGAAAREGSGPRLDLLAATTGGAPNVLSLYVAKAEPQGVKELDDNFVAMHFSLAQKLLYGRGERKALGIVLQLNRTEDMPAVRARLLTLIKDRRLDLEVRDFAELQPFYTQVIGMFGAIFSFLAVIMGVIVLFTVVNTMSMSVMERTSEIGTARAMGLRRAGIRRQFVIEGSLLGAIGATIGLVLAALLAFGVNHAGLTWTPPNQASPIPLRVLTSGVGMLNLAVWIGLVLMSTVAALLPANRAARLPVVDALRHI
jgi:putative ABC transport system permease protein